MSFMERAVAGEFGVEYETLCEAIDDAVSFWHDNPDLAPGSLHGYLGMTDAEYATWMLDPAGLVGIVENRKQA